MQSLPPSVIVGFTRVLVCSVWFDGCLLKDIKILWCLVRCLVRKVWYVFIHSGNSQRKPVIGRYSLSPAPNRNVEPFRQY